MPYDERVASRIRARMDHRPGYSERNMFGGVCFMIDGNMCCGVVKDELMLRLGEDLAREALEERHTRPMDFTGRAMKSMVYVEPAGFRDDRDLESWIDKAVGFVRTLPAK